MNTHIGLIKLLVEAVVNGRLVLNEKKGRVRFELFSEFCSASGALITRNQRAVWLVISGYSRVGSGCIDFRRIA